jgi:hypothetical protein
MKKTVLTLVLSVLLTSLGCGKGPKGDPGAPGAGKVTATMNCSGVISGLSGASAALNGLTVEYNAVLTSGGDVYATAMVADEWAQVSGTTFYAAGESGSQTAQVLINADFHSTADGAYWNISLNRSTLVTSITYTDPSLGSVVNMHFTSSACTVGNW